MLVILKLVLKLITVYNISPEIYLNKLIEQLSLDFISLIFILEQVLIFI